MKLFLKILSYIVFYLIQFTWGIIQNIIGLLVAIGMLVTGHKPHICGPYIYFIEPRLFGCMNGGIFFFTTTTNAKTNLHEMGHGLQNLMWGPLMIFVISIPSCIRFWYREWYWKHKYSKTGIALPAYDSIWFENQATNWGIKYCTNIWTNRK